MLVLTRRTRESVIVTLDGVDVEIVVLETNKTNVHLGFKAPDEVHIRRSELPKLTKKFPNTEPQK